MESGAQTFERAVVGALLTLDEVALRLGMSWGGAYGLLSRGELRGRLLTKHEGGPSWRVRPRDLRAYLDTAAAA